MPTLIAAPRRIAAAGNKPKLIEEFIGRVTSGEARLSVARMKSPPGWVEPGQTPESGGAEYIAVCLPAFAPDTVHRDAEPGIPG